MNSSIIKGQSCEIQNLAQKIASPATFATYASRWKTPPKGIWDPAKHLLRIDEAVTDLFFGDSEIDVLLIDCPPRHGKTLFNRWIGAWFLGLFPEKSVIYATYGAVFSREHGAYIRYLMELYGKEWFDVEVSKTVSAVAHWETTKGGACYSVGTDGVTTGRGCDLLLVDDYIKSHLDAASGLSRDRNWDWWESTAETRIEPGGKCIVTATRWHNDDLSGRLKKQLGLSIKHLSFPALAIDDEDPLGREPGEALWPERWSKEHLLKVKLRKSRYVWQSLYQGRPTTHERTTFDEECFTDILTEEIPDKFEVSVIYVDPSMGKNIKKGDYSAIVFAGWAANKLWIDCDLGRRPPTKICQDIIRMYRKYLPEAIGCESNGFQSMLAERLANEIREAGLGNISIYEHNSTINKVLRITETLDPYLNRKEIKILDNKGGRLLLEQLTDFPLASHDDGPDAVEGAVKLIMRRLAEPQEEN